MSLEGKSVDEITALAALADGLASDPKTRHGFLRLAKAANPNTAIPEVDIPVAMEAVLKAPLERLDALAARAAERDAQDSIRAKRDGLIAKGATADEIPKIEKLMVEKGIANHETALEHLRMSERAAEPTPPIGGTRRLERPSLPDLKPFNGNMRDWSHATAFGVIDELRGRRPH